MPEVVYTSRFLLTALSDGNLAAPVNIVVDIAPIGKGTNQKSVVMVQNLLSTELEQTHRGNDGGPYFVGELPLITLHKSLMTRRVPVDNSDPYTRSPLTRGRSRFVTAIKRGQPA